jgi:hypothetical protein
MKIQVLGSGCSKCHGSIGFIEHPTRYLFFTGKGGAAGEHRCRLEPR